jgi:FkbM family methyltransferase
MQKKDLVTIRTKMINKNNWWYVDECQSIDRVLNKSYIYGDSIINYEMIQIIENYYKENKKIKNHAVDIGANIGFMTAYFSKNWKKTTAFEPGPNAFECLKLNCNKENIILYNLALSDNEGQVLFAQGGRSEIDQIVLSDKVLKKNWKTIPIHTSYLDKFQLDNLDLIKIDVEGHELQVIKGAINTIKKNKPLIVLEISFENKILDKEISKDHTSALDLVLSLGYKKIWYGKHDYILKPLND